MSQVSTTQVARQWNFVEQGSGMPMLLVHGFPLDHSMWEGQLSGLATRCHLMAPDLPGFGRTPGHETDVLTMSQLADDLDDFLEQRNIDQPVALCGLSMGGYIAFQFWRRHRRRLGALILCDTRAAADTAEGVQTRRELAQRVLEDGSRVIVDTMTEKLLAPATLASRPELVERVQQVMASIPPETISAALLGMAQRENFVGSLSEMDVPVLLVCGENDVITPLDEMRQMASMIPAAQLIAIHNAGHLAPLEQPTAVNTAIHEFLRHIRPPRQ